MATYLVFKHLHIALVCLSVGLFILRFAWQFRQTASGQRRWVRVVVHIIDTLMLLSGVALVMITHFYPFSPQGIWLTEKLFGVIIYIVLGVVALGRRPRSQKVRWIAFLLALIVVYVIVKLAITKVPLLGLV